MGFFEDAGNFVSQAVSNTGQAIGQLANAVTGAVGDTLQGGGINAIGEKASKRFNQGFGAYGTIVGGNFLQTDAVKRAGSDPGLNTVTLGLAGDASGYGNFLQTSRNTGGYSQDDLNSGLRLTGKAIAIGAIAGEAEGIKYVYKDASAALSGTGEYAAYASAGLTGIKYASDLASGRAGDVVKDATGIPADFLNQPRNPQTSPPLGGRAPASGGTTVTSPWEFADSGILGSGQNDLTKPLLLTAVAVLAAYAYVRLRK